MQLNGTILLALTMFTARARVALWVRRKTKRLASPCQISSKSVEQLQRYRDLTVLKMVRHLGVL